MFYVGLVRIDAMKNQALGSWINAGKFRWRLICHSKAVQTIRACLSGIILHVAKIQTMVLGVTATWRKCDSPLKFGESHASLLRKTKELQFILKQAHK